jgi:hypothetical protein
MKKSLALLLFFLTAGARVVAESISGYTADDACISFRYAENLAAGAGFVYNYGERVLGTTSPLFTIVVALLNAAGIGSAGGACLINSIAAGLTSVVLYLWSQRLGMGKLSLLPPLLYTLFPRSVAADISGMESSLFTLLLTLAFYLLYRRKQGLALTLASLAAVTRPEGMALLIVLLLIVTFTHEGAIMSKIAPVLLILGNWLLFSYLYFGAVVPNSMLAKSALYQTHWKLGFGQSLAFLLGLNSAIGWTILVLTGLGIVIAWRNEWYVALIGGFSLTYLVTLSAVDTHLFFWYPAPVYPLLFVVIVFGLQRAGEFLLGSRLVARGWIAVAACLLVIAAALPRLHDKLEFLQWEMEVYSQVHQRAGEFLREHAAGGDRVLAEDIGHLGCTYGGRIIDRDGLVTPEALPYNRRGGYSRFVDSVAADWVFIAAAQPTSRAVLSDSSFISEYQLILNLEADGSNQYRLYRKRAGRS